MPVFQETASEAMLTRTRALLDSPLPRLTPSPPTNTTGPLSDGAKHEVVIIGTGPAGMTLSLLLTRLGLSPLSIDLQTTPVISGHADGLQPRTLEVLQTLGLTSEILRQGNQNWRIAFWNPKRSGPPGIERTAATDDVTVPSRYPFKILLAAGRIVAIMERQLEQYGGRIHRGVEMVDCKMHEGLEFPVEVKLREKESGREFTVWTKHLVGGDGAHSKVRQLGIGATLEGENTDYIWGVVDAVVKTDFPDIRKRCAIHSDSGSIMAIPREKIEGNQYLTRLYTQLSTAPPPPGSSSTSSSSKFATKEEQEASYQRALAQRRAITLPSIISQIRSTLSPYSITISHVDWWAAYHIGQRVATSFVRTDSSSIPRMLIMGDACHTHSPKAGQGMNVSMMDAYNLGWKLAYELLGLSQPGSLTSTYEPERKAVAQQLIDFDNAFASKFSQKIGADGTSHEEFFKTFHTGGGFTSGCGIEYAPSRIVHHPPSSSSSSSASIVDESIDPDLGTLTIGRRLSNIHVRHFGSEAPCELHDVLPRNGRWTVMLLLPRGFRAEKDAGVWRRRLDWAATAVPGRYVPGVVEPFVVLEAPKNEDVPVEWEDVGGVWRDSWGRNVVSDVAGEGWRRWAVREGASAWVLVRPDGVVGGIWGVEEERGVVGYLDGVLVKTGEKEAGEEKESERKQQERVRARL